MSKVIVTTEQELSRIVKDSIREVGLEVNKPISLSNSLTRIEGVRGLAKFLKVSNPTSQKFLKRHPEVIHRVGKKMFFYEEEIIETLKNSNY